MITRYGKGPLIAKAVAHGSTLYISGLVASTQAGQSIKAQVEDVLGQIDALLGEAGTDKSRLIWVSIWLADIADFDAMNEAWQRWVVPDALPARATVEAKLAGPDYAVEIAVIADIG